MSVVVVNRIRLRVPVDSVTPDVERVLGPAIRVLDGFERYYFVKAAENEAIVIIVWSTPEAAQAGAAVLGPTLFNTYIAPHAESQGRVVGSVVASAVAG